MEGLWAGGGFLVSPSPVQLPQLVEGLLCRNRALRTWPARALAKVAVTLPRAQPPRDWWQASDTAQSPSRSLASPLTWFATPTCSPPLHSWALLTVSITPSLTLVVSACSLLPGELGPCGLEKTDEQGR